MRFVLPVSVAIAVLLGLALWARSESNAPAPRSSLPAPAPGVSSARTIRPLPSPQPRPTPATSVAPAADPDLGPPTDPTDPRGDVSRLPKALRRALDPTDGFSPIHETKPGDWLAVHPEPGQTFEQFRDGRRNTPFRGRDVIRVFPLDAFRGDALPDVDVLVEYAAAFFQLPVKVTTSERLPAFTTRKGTAGVT